MELTFEITSLKTSGGVEWATSRRTGATPGKVGVLTPESEVARRVRSLALRGEAMVRPAQAKVARRVSEWKYIIGSARMQLKGVWGVDQEEGETMTGSMGELRMRQISLYSFASPGPSNVRECG